MTSQPIFDLAIIGAGVNGAGIARDAAGRGLSVVLLDAGDIGGATSSASTKLIHGGLRYLEFFEFGLVRKALAEREVILDAAPHISWPQSFVLPLVPGGRPAWMIRAGMFLYDHLAQRHQVPRSALVDLRRDAAGHALGRQHARGFRYWDGWIDDARLVILNAVDAAARGAVVLPRTRVVDAAHTEGLWTLDLDCARRVRARTVVNAAGPWADVVARDILHLVDAPSLRLVQGTHIVTRRASSASDAFMLQQPDGRVVFVIPYEQEFSLIGTTETAVASADDAQAREAEIAYLLEAVNRYLTRPLALRDVVHHFTGVRPLVLEAGKDARTTTRDWRFIEHAGAPALSIVGGKITTYRVLAEAVLARLAPNTKPWTKGVALPGGDVPRARGETGQAAFARWLQSLITRHDLYDPALVTRLARTHGTYAEKLLEQGLGDNLGGIFTAELERFAAVEWARTADDALWRRSKLALHVSRAARLRVEAWFAAHAECGPSPEDISRSSSL